MLFNFDFVDNTLIMLLFLFLIINLYFLIAAAIKQILNPTAELVIPIGLLTKEAKTEMEANPATVELKIRKCLIKHGVV